MRVVVLCASPGEAEKDPDSIAQVLRDLGCGVLTARFDGGELDESELERRPPSMVVVDAGDELERGTRSLRWLKEFEPLAQLPAILAVTLPRLPALDFSAGADDFVLKPVVPAELYARLRQLDWRSATFGSEEVIKIDELVIDLAGYTTSVSGRRLELTT